MKKIGIKIVICFIFLVSCSEELIDDSGMGKVKGRVVDAETFEPLANARISTSPTTSTFFTDKDGYFEFSEILVGKYSFQAQKDGYISKFEPATITKDVTVQIIFELDISTVNNKPPDIPV